MARECFEAMALAIAVIFLIFGLFRPGACDGFAQSKKQSPAQSAKQNTGQMLEVCNTVGLIRLILEAEDHKKTKQPKKVTDDTTARNDEGSSTVRRGHVGNHRGQQASGQKVDRRRMETGSN